MKTENKIIVSFRIGRGGRFNNPGFKTWPLILRIVFAGIAIAIAIYITFKKN